MDDVLRILAVLGLIGLNAFFVIGEYAVVTARRSAVAQLDSRGSAAALRLMDDPVRVISTVQVGITALGILTGAVGEPLLRDVLPEATPGWLAFVVAFGAVTYLSVVLGELVPKALTLDRAERLAVVVARPVEGLALILRPTVWVLQRSAEVVLRPFGVRDVVAGDAIRSSEELRSLVDEAEQGGVIARAQEELLHNVFDFATREARDVLVPVADVAWLDGQLPVADALRRATELAHTRYPVGAGGVDRISGVVHLRELARARSGTVADLATEALVVPETKDLGALLRDLRERRQQLAIVADEYGRTLGIVTLEDILEEIVGEIEDEYDLPDGRITREDDAYVVAGSITLDDLNEAAAVDLPLDGPRTLGGLVFDRLGRAPVVGDAVAVEGVDIEVVATDRARITRLRVRGPDGASAALRPPDRDPGAAP